MTYTVRPLSDRAWLRPDNKRESTRFSAKWPQTEALLLDEVAFLNGRNLVIEVDIRDQDLRLDGTLRANAREAATPAVIVAFESVHGPLLYRSDRFVAPWSHQGKHWQHNVRAIALTLQALRAVDRYGAAETGQQYTGYRAIGGGTPMPAGPTMSRQEAIDTLDHFADADDWATDADSPYLFKLARRATHPDLGGVREDWNRVEQAGRVLGLIR